MTADPFPDSASWDDEVAAEWAGRLDQRAADDAQARMRQRLCELAGLRPGDHAVEIGCGTGHLLIDLAAAVGQGGRVSGVEPQAYLAEQARTRVAANPAVAVHTGPAESLPFGGSSVDAVLAQTVLIHLPPATLDAVLAEVLRVLKPGGRFVSADQDADTRIIDHPDRETTRAIIRYATDELIADGWLGRRLPRLLREAGFAAVSVEAHPYLSTTPDSYLFPLRHVETAVDGGAITAEQGQRWLEQLRAQSDAGSFLAGVNYYLSRAIRGGNSARVGASEGK